MTHGEKTLRRLIREVLASDASDGDKGPRAETGPDVKSSPVARAAERRLDAFPSINSTLGNIRTTKDLQALVQNILDKVIEKGEINQQEMMLALSKTITSSKKAAQKKKKEEAEEEKKKKSQDLEKGVAS